MEPRDVAEQGRPQRPADTSSSGRLQRPADTSSVQRARLASRRHFDRPADTFTVHRTLPPSSGHLPVQRTPRPSIGHPACPADTPPVQRTPRLVERMILVAFHQAPNRVKILYFSSKHVPNQCDESEHSIDMCL